MSTASIQAKSEKLLQLNFNKLCIKTDKVLAIALIAQWMILIALALTVTPKTWIGASSSPNNHLIASIVLGGLVALFPALMTILRAGHLTTRVSTGIAFALMGGLFVHVGGGRIEYHFHYFASMAVLSLYRDWRVLIAATAIAAADHAFRGIFWTQSMYGIETASKLRWIEHAVWLVAEVGFLIYMTRTAMADMRSAADREAKLDETADAITNAAADLGQQLANMETTNNLTNSITVDQESGLGNIAIAIDGFMQSMRQTIEQISDTTQLTREASEQIAGAAVETSGITQSITNRATDAMQRAENASLIAEEGGHVIARTIENIGDMQGKIEESAEAVDDFVNASDSIAGFVQTIVDIADQTNLLALNAAIEAARAGDQGRGFAVVADEVRKLADRSSTAASEISQAIQELRNNSSDAAERMRRTVEQAMENGKLASGAAENLDQIVIGVRQVSQDISDITESIREVNSAAELSSEACDGLAKTANSLAESTGRFIV
ncbi:MAG: methyl-accepting chemotaxis protein [Phycisphaerales bacterium]